MRLSTTVKGYISEQVAKIYDVKIKSLREKKSALSDENNKLKAEITLKIKEFAKSVVEDNDCEFSNKEDLGWCYSTRISLNGFYYTTPIDKEMGKIEKEIHEIKQEQSKALQNIFVTLELGGNKQDLERLLKDLAESVKN